ncbi:MAG TPA: alpha/beta hydrolase [Steroidobacteraceae bacterium]|nr:alpha/beta hydrolase [Steroidobacteraceae bacterium]
MSAAGALGRPPVPLRSILVLTAPGDAYDAQRATRWPRESGAPVRVRATDRPDAARQAIESNAADAVAAALGAARDAPLARLAGDLRMRDRWIDYTPAPLARAADGCISGRAEHSLTWALGFLVSANAHPYAPLRYGADAEQIGDLRLPSPAPARPPPLVVLLHGGFWREAYRRDVLAPLAVDLARRGVATWNVEYRRVGGSGGGCPATFADVAAAVDFTARLRAMHALDPAPPIVLGHSAGGHLALWCAARRRLPPGMPGSEPAVAPSLVVAIGALADLAEGRRLELGAGAVDAFVPARADEAWTNPRALLPLGTPQLLVHGTLDESVPYSIAAAYVEAARAAGDRVDWLPLPAVTHMPPIDPRSDAWGRIVEALCPRLFAVGGGS